MLCDQFFVVFAHCVFTDQAPDIGYGSVGFRLSIKHIVLHKFHVINGSHFIRNTIHDHAESKMIILVYCIPHAFLSIFCVFLSFFFSHFSLVLNPFSSVLHKRIVAPSIRGLFYRCFGLSCANCCPGRAKWF